MLTQEQANRRMELALWKVKDAAWDLYGDSWNHDEVQALAIFIADSITEMDKKLGFDPSVLVR